MPTFGDRLKRARRSLEEREGGERIASAELGVRLARQMRRRKPFGASTFSEWEGGGAMPRDVRTLQALAEVLGVRFEWLAIGRGAMLEEGAEDPPATMPPRADVESRGLTPEEERLRGARRNRS